MRIMHPVIVGFRMNLNVNNDLAEIKSGLASVIYRQMLLR